MRRTVSANADPNKNGTGKAGFVTAVPGVSAATTVSESDLNMFQEELSAAVEQAGATALDSTGANKHQLSDVLRRIRASNDLAAVMNLSRVVSPGVAYLAAASGGSLASPLHAVVGAGGVVARSLDQFGTLESATTTSGTENLLSVCYFPLISSFVTAGWSQAVYTSNNIGTVWTARTSAVTGTLRAVAPAPSGNAVVAVGDGAGSAIIQTSPSGTTWTSRNASVPSGVSALIALGTNGDGTTLVAVGAHGTDGSVCVSTDDGATWVETAQITGAGLLISVTYSAAEGLWYVATTSAVWSSPNLSSWTSWGLAAPLGGRLIYGVIALPQTIVVLTVDQTHSTLAYVKASITGASWRTVPGFGVRAFTSGPAGTPALVVPYYGDVHAFTLWIADPANSTFSLGQWSSAP